MISIISTFFVSLCVLWQKKTKNVEGCECSIAQVKVLCCLCSHRRNSIFYFYSQNRLFPNKKKHVHCIRIYIHKLFFFFLFNSYCQNHFCSFGNSFMALSFSGTFSREWKKKRIWKQTFLSLSWLWIVLMITIDPPPERVKIHAGVKKKILLLWSQDGCIHGWNGLCNFHRAPVVRFSTSSPTVLKEYTIIFLRSLM